jgi:flagellum-specific ATP synthase
MNHFPAIDILSSISRLMPQIAQENHYQKASELRDLLAIYKESEDLINVGAYQKGSNNKIDKALALNDKINGFLKQKMNEHYSFTEVLEMLNSIN